jgi:hypothetical protein
MYKTITEADFIDAFDEMGRSENFSRPARQALFRYLTDLEDDIGEPAELDVIAICCDWAELTAAELAQEYAHMIDAPPVYEHRVNLDERGEFSATIYRHHLDGEPEWIADYGTEEREFLADEGVDLDDYVEILERVTGRTGDVYGSEEEAEEAVAEQFEELLDVLRDETQLIEVDHYEKATTYLVLAF